jgi:hypothetical protein
MRQYSLALLGITTFCMAIVAFAGICDAQPVCNDRSSQRECYEAGLAQVGTAIAQFKSLQNDIQALKDGLQSLRDVVSTKATKTTTDQLQTDLDGLSKRIDVVAQKTRAISASSNNFVIDVGPPGGPYTHYDFPLDGNFNFGFNDGIVCGAANDRARPNAHDLTKCFKH